MEALCESSSWKENPEEILRYPSCMWGKKKKKKRIKKKKEEKRRKKKKKKADLNNYAMWLKSDLFQQGEVVALLLIQ